MHSPASSLSLGRMPGAHVPTAGVERGALTWVPEGLGPVLGAGDPALSQAQAQPWPWELPPRGEVFHSLQHPSSPAEGSQHAVQAGGSQEWNSECRLRGDHPSTSKLDETETEPQAPGQK